MPTKDQLYGTPPIEILKEIVSTGWEKEHEYFLQVATDPRLPYFLTNRLNIRHREHALYAAKLTGCCVSMRGAEIIKTIPPTVNTECAFYKIHERMTEEDWHHLGNLLYIASTVRLVNLLRFLGLYHQDSENMIQLSLGAGGGTNELDGMHISPAFKIDNGKIKLLSAVVAKPDLICLVDKTIETKEVRQYRKICFPKSIYYTSDAQASLTPTLIKTPATLVTMLRLAPEMIRTEKPFFHQLATVVAPEADLIVTVGGGNTLKEWNDRTIKINQINEYLQSLGLPTHLIDLTQDGTREHPLWGLPNYSHLKVLHCKLDKNLLLR